MKRILLTVLAVIMLFSVGGCSKKPYAGDRADLYTVALNSLLWVSGVSWEGDKETDPTIEILEEDSYGRVLFTYREKNFGSVMSFCSMLIMQKTEDGSVYFYPDVNAVCLRVTLNGESTSFPEETIASLKEQNDWNKEVDVEKCVKKEIGATPLESIKEGKENAEIIYEALSQYKTPTQWTFYKGMSDDYGRAIYHGWMVDSEGRWESLALLLNLDMTYDSETCYFTPANRYDYMDELQAFKALNHWNEPIA